MATTHTLLTAEQFAQLPDDGIPRELERGEVVEMNRPGYWHGFICNEIGAILRAYVRPQKLGRVVGNDAGVVTQRHPDSVRGPDIAYYSFSRVPEYERPEKYPVLPPELVFEVLSPEDRWPKVLQKVSEYLSAGVLAVCVVDPGRNSLTLYSGNDAPKVFGAEDTLELPGILPGWTVKVSELLGL